MPRETRRRGLAQIYARWLAALFVALETVTFAAVLGFVMLPMAERAADDLAGLMVLSARTWVELPPQTRAAFEDELARAHQIALRPGMAPAADSGLRHGFYIRYLERTFARRLGHEVFFERESASDGSEWLWVAIPAGERHVGVGFDRSRLQTNPFAVLTAALGAGLLLVGALAWWLAERIAQPVARFEHAVAQLASGAQPEPLPQSGPRELAELARHFNHMAQRVRELADARTTLFAGLSHDLRTPLARMRLALEMLTLQPAPALLQRLETDIEEMNRLIGQLLDIARGLQAEAAQALDLAPWLQARAGIHHEASAAAGASINVQCPAGLRALAAPATLARVLDNLLGNALRYAAGPIELLGQALPPEAGEPARVRIGVLDLGPAIPQDQLRAVFRPFHRIEGAAQTVPGGFGLGLAIVQQLAQANGWRAHLERREGGGLAAWVELPAAP